MSKVKLEGVICNDFFHIILLIAFFCVPQVGVSCVFIYTESLRVVLQVSAGEHVGW